MSKGDSGRIVIEIEPDLKRRLYSRLAMDGSTLKDWFIQCAENYATKKSVREAAEEKEAGART